MKMIKTLFLILIMMFCIESVAARQAGSMRSISHDTIPSLFKGNFIDDYGISYSINDSLWTQHPHSKYHIIVWDTLSQFILARNDDSNPAEGGLFTRIDYMKFRNMEPFQWGFCLTVYNAKTIEDARAEAKADTLNPKTGCGGYPFSRMRIVLEKEL